MISSSIYYPVHLVSLTNVHRLVTLQACIADTEQSLKDVMGKINQTLEKDEHARLASLSPT